MAFPETHGNVVERLAELERAINSWANPLRDPDPLRYAVVELIDIVHQLVKELVVKEKANGEV